MESRATRADTKDARGRAKIGGRRTPVDLLHRTDWSGAERRCLPPPFSPLDPVLPHGRAAANGKRVGGRSGRLRGSLLIPASATCPARRTRGRSFTRSRNQGPYTGPDACGAPLYTNAVGVSAHQMYAPARCRVLIACASRHGEDPSTEVDRLDPNRARCLARQDHGHDGRPTVKDGVVDHLGHNGNQGFALLRRDRPRFTRAGDPRSNRPKILAPGTSREHRFCFLRVRVAVRASGRKPGNLGHILGRGKRTRRALMSHGVVPSRTPGGRHIVRATYGLPLRSVMQSHGASHLGNLNQFG